MPPPQAEWGEPPWRVALSVAPRALPRDCRVAVIGGGFTGLSTAYHLARRGWPVAVLEAGRIGDGASGRTGGLALEGTAHGPMPAVEHCLDELAGLVAEAGIDCDLELGGCWEVAHAKSPARGDIRWRDGGSWLGAVQRVPGGTIDPGKLVAGLARAALAAGATVHESAAVRQLEGDAPIDLRLADGTTCRAEHVVVALNGYTGDLLPLPLELRAPLTLALCTAPLDPATIAGLGLRQPFYTVDLPYLWGRCLADGRLIFGAGLAFPASGDSVRGVDIAARESADIMARLEQRVHGLHPALAEVAITHRWGGPIAFRADAVPMLGRLPDRPRVLVAGAYAGHGVALSVRIGRLLADAIAAGAPLPSWGELGA